MKVRYHLVSDDSGHKYALPVGDPWPNNDDEFETFEIPDAAIRIDGRFTFSEPRCE